MEKYSWVGSQKHYIDEIHTELISNTIIVGHIVGHFGGNSSAGQTVNEDGCFILKSQEGNWEFMMILDAHNTAESA